MTVTTIETHSAGVTSAWHVEEHSAWRGFSLEWASESRLLFARGTRIYQTDLWGVPPSHVGTFPQVPWRRLAACFRPSQRLLRLMFYNVLPLRGGALLATFDRSMGVFRDGTLRQVEGLRRPCRVLRGGCAVTTSGDIYFGEYFDNADRGPVYVYHLEGNVGRAEVAHCFPADEIRHVHGVYRDPYTDDLWCLTGDRPEECRIMVTRDQFATHDVVGSGDESWRAVSLQFTPDAIYYGSDAEFTDNHLYRIERATGKREKLCPVSGPVYYSCQAAGQMFFAVTAELCPSQSDRRAALWHVDASGSAQSVLAFEKDALHKTYFMPGTLHFPAGPGTGDAVHFHAVGLRGADNRLYSVSRAA